MRRPLLHSRLSTRLALAVILALGFWQFSSFFRYGGTAPFFSYDDSLANVAFSLADLGRYGFLSSPLLGDRGVRADSFFNYGPFYFAVGAALSWLFGSSVLVLRAIHPGAIAAITVLALWWFGRRNPALTMVMAMGAWAMFELGQWPMIRPDPLVSVFALGGAVAAGRGILNSRAADWVLAGALCCAAPLTHPVAWPIAAGLIAVWLIWSIERLYTVGMAAWPDLLRTAAAAAAGALLPIAVFLAAIGSNLPAFLTFVGNYRGSMEQMGPGFWANGLSHFMATWGALSRVWWLGAVLALGNAAGTILLICSIKMDADRRRRVLALVLPPLGLWLSYEVGMAALPKYHSGYTIFSQMGAWWSACAGLAALGLVKRPGPVSPARFHHVGLMFLAVALLGSIPTLGVVGQWSGMADAGPPFARIQAEVDALLPQRATIWGPALMGMRAGVRTDLVATEQAVELAASLPPEERAKVLPQFLMISGEDFYSWATHSPADLQEGLRPYVIVSAPPYGPIRIYCRECDAKTSPLPHMAVFDRHQGRWWRGAFPQGGGAPIMESVAPARVESLAPEGGDFVARQTLKTNLAEGLWAVMLRLDPGEGGGQIVTHGAPRAALSLDGNRFTRAVTPYFPGETRVFALLEHGGGPLYLSLLGARSGFSVESAVRLTAPSDGAEPFALPPLSLWRPSRLATASPAPSPGGMTVTGAEGSSGYLLLSPLISIPARSEVTFRVQAEGKSGVSLVGILNRLGGWRVPPQDPSLPLRLTTRGHGEEVTLVVLTEGAVRARPTIFTLSDVTATLRSMPIRPLYGEVLARCAEGKGCP